ncbi:MAG: MFS transporter [Candidatus Dormibacteraceae bacterium]
MRRRHLPRSLRPLRHTGFRLLTAGQVVSNLGDALYAVALPWYVLSARGDTVLLGAVLAAYGIPRAALLLAGGHASDRWHPWTIMMAADGTRAAAAAAFAIAALSGRADAYVLVPIALVLGAGEGFFLPASRAIVPSLLPGEDLQAGNAMTSGANQLTLLVGPAVGGVVVAAFGPAPAFAIDALSFAVSAATLLGVRAGRRRPSPETVPGTGSAEPGGAGPPSQAESRTLRGLLTERALIVLLAIFLAGNLTTGGLVEVALPALAHGPLQAGARGYGALVAALAVGGLAGTLAVGQVRRPGRPAIVCSVAYLLLAGLIGVAPYLPGAVAVGIVLGAAGVCNGFGDVLFITTLQRWAPIHLMARIMSLVLLASLGSFPLSVVVAGVFVRAFGPALFFPAAGIVIALAVTGGLTQREWRGFGASER